MDNANAKAEIIKCIEVLEKSSNQNAEMITMGLKMALSIIEKFTEDEK